MTRVADDTARILQDNRTLHRATAGLYDTVHPHMRNSYEQQLQAADIRFMLRRLTGSGSPRPHVLDLGCGTGNLTVRFLEEGATVTAVDMSAEMLQVLSSKMSAASNNPSIVSGRAARGRSKTAFVPALSVCTSGDYRYRRVDPTP